MRLASILAFTSESEILADLYMWNWEFAKVLDSIGFEVCHFHYSILNST